MLITNRSGTLTHTSSNKIDLCMTTDNIILAAKVHTNLKTSDSIDEVEVEVYLPIAVAVIAASCLAILKVRQFKAKIFSPSTAQTHL